eukprot:8455455-Pyramimonas_sp.AAC.1
MLLQLLRGQSWVHAPFLEALEPSGLLEAMRESSGVCMIPADSAGILRLLRVPQDSGFIRFRRISAGPRAYDPQPRAYDPWFEAQGPGRRAQGQDLMAQGT